MNNPSLGKLKENQNKKIILKPAGYYDHDLSILPENLNENELDKFVSLVNDVKDEVDLIFINPLELNSVDKGKAEAFRGKLIFNSKSADYVIVDYNTQATPDSSSSATPSSFSLILAPLLNLC